MFNDRNFKDFVAEFGIGEEPKDVYYQFIDEIYLQLLNREYYVGSDSKIGQERINQMVDEVGNFERMLINILNVIIIDFMKIKIG